MANQEQVERLRTDVAIWNEWRERISDRVDLSGADLSNRDFLRANLSNADLSGADLGAADLSDADLSNADLRGAYLWNATLRGATLWNADLFGANLGKAILRNAELGGANLCQADLRNADLGGANLRGALLREADIGEANLQNAQLAAADLAGARLGNTDLTGATLRGAVLTASVLTGANLRNADLGGAILFRTVLSDLDLSETRGLDCVQHQGPSFVGIETLYASEARIPDEFLRGAGVPEHALHHFLPMIRSAPPSAVRSYFITHSPEDRAFAQGQLERMRLAGLRAWLAPEDGQGGPRAYERILKGLGYRDRLIVVLSVHSLRSNWIGSVIRTTLEQERRENRRRLFLIGLVPSPSLQELIRTQADLGPLVAYAGVELAVLDFSNWEDSNAFDRTFARLKSDLEHEAANTGKGQSAR